MLESDASLPLINAGVPRFRAVLHAEPNSGLVVSLAKRQKAALHHPG